MEDWRGSKVAFIRWLREVGVCAGCGQEHPPWRFDFDHSRGAKVFAIAWVTNSNVTWIELLAELAKCDLICANCHRDRTHSRGRENYRRNDVARAWLRARSRRPRFMYGGPENVLALYSS